MVVHELAHCLTREDLVGAAIETDAELDRRRRTVLDWIEDVSTSSRADQAVPFYRHEWPFIRTAIHLSQRFRERFPHRLDLDLPCGGEQYGLSPAETYLDALGDEPERFRHEPFSTIHSTRPPAAFVDLWLRDVRNWYLSQADLSSQRLRDQLQERSAVIFPSPA